MTATTRVELQQDDGILSHRDLADATTRATEQFAEWYEKGPPTRTPSTVRIEWRKHDAVDGIILAASVGEREADGSWRGFSRSIPARQLIEPVARGIWATRLWRYLLQSRSVENMQRIEQAVQEIERGEADG